ncbi:MAG: Mediator of RNA polymerase II transcription subunit 6 [Icmadophila ericetorum]|nr:Mediator of RNA polymerase II transcription subunit 6 [Icmadophila ericetorum]
MEIAQEPLLDEIQWRSPQIAQSLPGGIHTDSVLRYFAHSPFFDATSNNAVLLNQATYNPQMHYLILSREAFEARLRSMQGVEFVVAQDPSNKGQLQEHNGVWVIRKQSRRKIPGSEDEITPISLYFVVGENVYMAPSVGNILGSRLLSTVTSLTKLMSSATSFSASLSQMQSQTTRSRASSGAASVEPHTQPTEASKESTPLPGTQGTSTTNKTSSSDRTLMKEYTGANLLADSFSLSVRYGSEFMDESPLTGEPNHFRIEKVHQKPLEAVPLPPSQLSITSTITKPSAPPTPAPLKTDIPPAPVRKGSKAGDKTPVTPGFKDKKGRKKSKVTMEMPK